MELLNDFLSIPTLLITLLTIFLLLINFLKSRDHRNKPNLPPGPPRLPVIGNLHQLAVYGLPHRGLRRLAEKYGPLMHLQLGQVSTVVISSSEVARQVMRTHDVVFAQRPSLLLGQILLYKCTDIAFSPYGDYWRKLRNICMLELLSPKRVQSFQRIREEEATNWITIIGKKAGSTINLTEMIFKMTNSVVARTALGIEGKDEEIFAAKIGKSIEISSKSGAADLFPSVKWVEMITGIRQKMEKMFQQNDQMIEGIINAHRTKKNQQIIRTSDNKEEEEEGEDLVDVLLKFENDASPEFSLTIDNIKAVLFDVWMAGVDTSATAIEWAMSEMLRNPHVMQKAQAEVRQAYQGKETVNESNFHKLDYLKLIIKETLRLHPSLPLLLPRESSSQCQIFGFDIPPKVRVIVNAWAIGRDPTVWTEPDTFNPERFLDSLIDYKGNNFEFIPFGAGRRMCPGLAYGLALIEIQLAMLLYHFDWTLPNGMRTQDLDMSETFGLSAKRNKALLIIPTPYSSSFVS